jgi:hypothetical protein
MNTATDRYGAIYPAVRLDRPALRVGIMLDTMAAPAWVESIVSSVKKSGFAEIALAIVRAPDNPAPSRMLPIGRTRNRPWKGVIGRALYHLYVELDNKAHPQFLAPFETGELQSLLEDVPKLFIRYRQSGSPNQFGSADIQSIRDYELDVILRFGFDDAKGEILTVARYGVWSNSHADQESFRQTPAFLKQMVENKPVSMIFLSRVAESRHGAQIIYRSYSATESRTSLSHNRGRAYLKGTAFTLRCLRQIYAHGETGLRDEMPCDENEAEDKAMNEYRMLPFLGRTALTLLKNRVTKEQWFFAYRKPAQSTYIVPDMKGFIPIVPPMDRLYADPFPITVNGRDYVFFENMDYKSNKGIISYVCFDESGRPGAVKNALITDHHLSYPFLFAWQGNIYLVPETAQSNAVKLYRAASFPERWEFVGNLIEGVKAVDTTLHEHGDAWYMFMNISECGGSANDELFLFVSETPLGPWTPHPLNPVKSDARSARPAGRIFEKDGKLIRPSQDCTVTYGYGINFCEIKVLSRTEYEECIVGRIHPSWLNGLTGTHTYNRTDTIEVVDGKRVVWKYAARLMPSQS